MELLESQDPEKRRLIEKSEQHKRELEKEVSELSDKTQKVLTNALVIGGALALSYFVVRQLTGKAKKKKKKKLKPRKQKLALVSNGHAASSENEDGEEEEMEVVSAAPNLISEIGSRVVNHATIILIDLARQKLMEYLESRKKDETP